jgi:hypothetical protein
MIDYRQLLAATALTLFGVSAPVAWAEDDDDCDEEYDVDLFAEVNSTDGDVGIQLKLDGEQWKSLEIETPEGDEVLDVKTRRSIRHQGLTEFFFESAEPSFEEQSLADFLALFPEGEYEFDGDLVEGGEICGTAEYTHNLPGAPETDADLNGDGNLVISWEEVEDSYDHPDAPVRDIEIESYEVIAEVVDGDVDFDIVLRSDDMQVTLPPEFMAAAESGDAIKYEVIAKEESGNQTITEGTFLMP